MRWLPLVVIAALVLALGSTIAGCRKAPMAAARDESVLRVGITAQSPPFAFRQAGALAGLEPALANHLGQYLQRRVEFVEVPWSDQIDHLLDGKTDIIMSGMTITAPRSQLVDFTLPYLRSGQIMLVRLEDAQRFGTGVSSILNSTYRIGTVADTVSDYFITATIQNANEVAFSSPQQAVEALIARDIDVFIYDAPIVCYYAARHQRDKLVPILNMATEEYIGWAVRKQDRDLLAKVNDFIETIGAQGTLREEINYWIPYLYR